MWSEYWGKVNHSTLEKWVSKYKTKYGYPKMVELLANGRCGRSLEVGAGTAYLSYLLTHRGWDTTALDLANYGSLAQRFVCGSAFGLPFTDKAFDLVFSCGFVEHFNTREVLKHLTEMERVGVRWVCLFPTCDWKWKLLWKLRGVPKGINYIKPQGYINFCGFKYGYICT